MTISTFSGGSALTIRRPAGAAPSVTKPPASTISLSEATDRVTLGSPPKPPSPTGPLAAREKRSFLARNVGALTGTAVGLTCGAAIGLCGGALGAVAGAVAAPVFGVIGGLGGAAVAGKVVLDSYLKSDRGISSLLLVLPLAIGGGLAVGGTAGFMAGGLLGVAGGATGGALGAGAVGLTLGALGGGIGYLVDGGSPRAD